MEFVDKIQEIFDITNKNGSYEIKISAHDNPLINEKAMASIEDGVNLYVEYLKSGVAQDINLDLSTYKYVYIKARWSSSDAQEMSIIIRVGDGGLLFSEFNARVYRPVFVSSNKVTFGTGQNGALGASATTVNTSVIPQVIYGIK